jgi:hypothetical protein
MYCRGHFFEEIFRFFLIIAIISSLIDKARIWYDTIKKDNKGHGLHPIRRWKDFKKLFLKEVFPNTFQSQMR